MKLSLPALVLILSTTAWGFQGPPLPAKIATPSVLYSSTRSQTDHFIKSAFYASDADDVNTPPSLSIVLKSIDGLANGSDIRGKFVDHARVGSFANVAHAISAAGIAGPTALTPFAAHCLGHGFATLLRERFSAVTTGSTLTATDKIRICIGSDPRPHGVRLADAFARGCGEGVEVVYTGIATTPSMMDFCRTDLCDAAIILTASHLPVDRNGMKFFVAGQGGLTKDDIQDLIAYAKEHAYSWQATGIMPPTSGQGGVFCAQHVSTCVCSVSSS